MNIVPYFSNSLKTYDKIYLFGQGEEDEQPKWVVSSIERNWSLQFDMNEYFSTERQDKGTCGEGTTPTLSLPRGVPSFTSILFFCFKSL